MAIGRMEGPGGVFEENEDQTLPPGRARRRQPGQAPQPPQQEPVFNTAPASDDEGANARYGPEGPGPARGMPSPESMLSGGNMNRAGRIAPTRPMSPTPVSTQPPVPNPLPNPSPRAMTSLSGMEGGLLGGGLGVPGKLSNDTAKESPLIALLASMMRG